MSDPAAGTRPGRQAVNPGARHQRTSRLASIADAGRIRIFMQINLHHGASSRRTAVLMGAWYACKALFTPFLADNGLVEMLH